MSWYRKQLEDWLGEQDVKADTVLDIGGQQLPAEGRTRSWEVGKYVILDLPGYDLNQPEPFKPFANTADTVFCLEVFEYLINPLQGLINIRNILKPNGKGYVTFAFVYPHHNELDRDSLRYTETGVKRLAEAARMKINDVTYRTDKSQLLESFYKTDGMKCAREYPDHSVTGFIVELGHAD